MKRNAAVSQLNSQDFLMLALDDTMPSLGIVLTFRFKEPHSVSEMREAMRYMFTVYPRLRSVVEPTLFSYRLRILNDHDQELEVLFNEAFRVKYGLRCDSEEYIDYRRALLNEPFSLQCGLPLKIRYLPDDPQPMLLLSLHHMAGDGMSWLHLMDSLLRYLNNDKPPQLPLDDPNMLPALVKRPHFTLPAQIRRSFQLFKEDIRKAEGLKMIPASSRPADFFSPAEARMHILPFDIDRIMAKCKELNVGVNILLLSALALAVSRGPGRDQGDMIGIAIPTDLRPYYDKPPIFGNFVSTFWVRIHRRNWSNPKAMLNEVKTQMYARINRYKNKEMIAQFLIEKLSTLAGKKLYSLGARIAKRKGLLPMTCSYSAIGNIDSINSYGSRARICEAMCMFPHFAIIMITINLEGKIFAGLSYPEAEFTRDEINAFIQSYNQALAELLEL